LPEVESIESLSGFMQYVENLPSNFNLSRGQTGDFPLLPSALRKDERDIKKYSRHTITFFLNEFKVNSHNYMPNPWDIKNDLEWMIYAQHYGIPTRLLDFTYSHIVSLMFAVETAFYDKECEDAVVWFLNPHKLNDAHAHRSEIITISNEPTLNLDNYVGPVAIQGRKLNVRINAQNGVFVYFQDTENPLQETVTDEEVLRKIIIEAKSKKGILSSLYSMGIGFTQIYPELTSVAKDILMKNNINEYIKEEEEG
jgi:hypothetical protein